MYSGLDFVIIFKHFLLLKDTLNGLMYVDRRDRGLSAVWYTNNKHFDGTENLQYEDVTGLDFAYMAPATSIMQDHRVNIPAGLEILQKNPMETFTWLRIGFVLSLVPSTYCIHLPFDLEILSCLSWELAESFSGTIYCFSTVLGAIGTSLFIISLPHPLVQQ